MHQIERLFQTLDKDSSGTFGFDELRAGLNEMQFQSAVVIGEDDYDILTV